MDSQSYYTQPLQAAFPDSDGLTPKVWAPPPNPSHVAAASPTGNIYDASFPNAAQPASQQQQWQSAAGAGGAGGVRQRQSPVMRSSSGPVDDAAFSSLMSNPLAQAAFTAYGAQVQKQMSGLLGFLNVHKLKYYFHVNNRYVLNKLSILLLPFAHKHWKRQPVDSAEQVDQYGQPSATGLATAYKPPSEDVNAPDLYIPTMAFFTYILLMSYAYAATHVERTFDPELIGVLASSTLVALLLETALCRFGLYLISADNVPHLLDLLAYLSYKYVHAIVCLSLALSGGSGLLYWGVVLVMGALQGLFMMRTMKRALTPVIDSSTLASPAGGGMGGGAMRNNYLLLIVGALQIVIVAFLVRGAV